MSDEVSEIVEYNLEASLDAVGYLYPTIVDKHDRIIDGEHRLKVDPKWPCFRLSHIESMTEYLMARIIANMHRRQPGAEEKTRLLSELAQETGWSPDEIAKRIGMSYRWVTKYLPVGYKDEEASDLGRRGGAASKKAREARSKTASAARRAPTKLSEARQPQPGFHIKKDGEDTDRFLDGLENLYFLKPGDKLTAALVDYCRTRKIHWSIVVTEGLKLFFHSQGAEL